MDAQLARYAYTALFALVGILHVYNARQYATLIRASFVVNGILFLLFALAISFVPLTDSFIVLINTGLIATFILALIIVQIIIALNGRITPWRRRKGE